MASFQPNPHPAQPNGVIPHINGVAHNKRERFNDMLRVRTSASLLTDKSRLTTQSIENLKF